MSLPGMASLGQRASSETLGVAVLIGMTVLVTAGLGMGVLVISEQEQEQTAEIDFTFLGDTLVIIYQDETERVAGNLYIDGPDNNLTWAELDGELESEDMVGEGTDLRISSNTPYGSQPSEDDAFDVVYFAESGERFVLASVNREDDEESPLGPDDAPSPDDPDF